MCEYNLMQMTALEIGTVCGGSSRLKKIRAQQYTPEAHEERVRAHLQRIKKAKHGDYKFQSSDAEELW